MLNADTCLPMHTCQGIATWLLVDILYAHTMAVLERHSRYSRTAGRMCEDGQGESQLQFDATARADRAGT